MKLIRDNALAFGLLVVCVLVLGRALSGRRAAETPAVFAQALGFEEALARSEEGRRPVFAVASASWCGPCQGYKRGALSDERVESWVSSHTVPVFIDVDHDRDAAERLGVRSIPATFLLRDGNVIARAEGAMSAESLLGWLERGTKE